MGIQKIIRRVTIVAIFLIPLFPLIVTYGLASPFVSGKAFFFRILVEIAFAGWVALALVDPKYRPRFTPLTIAVCVFTFIVLIADLVGVDPLRSLWSNLERMEGWVGIIHLWAMYIVMACMFDRRLWHRWFNISLLVALAVSVYGLFQLFGFTPYHYQVGRLDALFGNPAYMAEYMLMSLFIAMYMFFVQRTNLLRWTYPLLSVLFSFEIFETATRSAILGAIGGIMAALACYAIFGKKEPNARRFFSGGVLGLIVIVIAAFFFNRTAPIFQANYTLSRLAAISWSNTNDQARQYIWPIAIKGIVESPFIGWGQENFNYIFDAHYDPAMYAQEQWSDRAHDAYLDWAVASGLIGLIAYLALYALFISAVWRSSLSIAQKSTLIGLVISYAVFNIFTFDTLASYVLFFALLAFARSLDEALSATKPSHPVIAERFTLPTVIAIFALVIYFVNVRPIEASMDSIIAFNTCSEVQPNITLFRKVLDMRVDMVGQDIDERLLSCAVNVISNPSVPEDTKVAIRDLAIYATQIQILSSPNDARPYAVGGAFLDQIGDYVGGGNLLIKAHELMPAKETISFELALNYLYQGEKNQALALLKEVYDSEPQYYKAKAAYAIGLIIAGDSSDAARISGIDPSTLATAQSYVSSGQYTQTVSLIRDMLASQDSDISARIQQAQILYASGRISEAIAAMRSIGDDHPELKGQIEAAVKEIQK